MLLCKLNMHAGMYSFSHTYTHKYKKHNINTSQTKCKKGSAFVNYTLLLQSENSHLNLPEIDISTIVNEEGSNLGVFHMNSQVEESQTLSICSVDIGTSF